MVRGIYVVQQQQLSIESSQTYQYLNISSINTRYYRKSAVVWKQRQEVGQGTYCYHPRY